MPSDAAPSRALGELVAELERLAAESPTACLERTAELLPRVLREGDRHAELVVRYFSGTASHVLGEAPEALGSVRAALALARELGDRDWEARVLSGLGNVHAGYGDHAAAIECLEQSLHLRRELGDRLGVAIALHNLGVTYDEMGLKAERARELLSEAHRAFTDLDHVVGRAGSAAHLGSLETTRAEDLARTDPDGAAAAAGRAVDHLALAVDLARREPVWPALLGELLVRYARALVAHGDLAGADAALREAEGMPALAESVPLGLLLATVRAHVARASGDPDAAVVTLETALARADGLRHGRERVGLLDQLVRAHEERGDLTAALATYRRLHREVIAQRDDVADVRARVLGDRIALERAQVEAEKARLRARNLEQANAELAYEAMHDPLTDLANRRAYDAALAARTASPDDDVALVLADLDNFKDVNDQHSHVVGDEVLRVVARLVAGAVRGSDLVARIGGEEIAVVLDRARTVDVEAVCHRIGEAIRSHDWSALAPGLHVTASLGVAVRAPGEPADVLVQRADRLLYRAKSAGRDRVVLDPALTGGPASAPDAVRV